MKTTFNFTNRLALLLLITLLLTSCNKDEDDYRVVKNTVEGTMEDLGKKIFFDKNLSSPTGLACASCHSPTSGFADPRKTIVSEGTITGRYGNRNAPAAAYTSFVPPLHLEENDGELEFVGGLFWDGRTSSLELQALLPIKNHLEENDDDDEIIIDAVRNSSYANLFYKLFGDNALDNIPTAMSYVATAIASYERSIEFNKFSSKFDKVQNGETTFTSQEKLGYDLFNDEQKGNCFACHPSTSIDDELPILFTDFSYDNLGIPKNLDNPFLQMPADLNPDGPGHIDLGLYNTTKRESDKGKFRVPSLRNVGVTTPYGHNGYFKTLEEIVHFYNVKNSGIYPSPEVKETENKEELGELNLTPEEEAALVAFLKTLTDV